MPAYSKNHCNTLQKNSSAAETQHVTWKMRSDENFGLFFKLILSMQKNTATDPPKIPIERRAPSRFIEGTGEAYHAPTVEEHYRRQYYEAIHCTVATIEKHFDQPDYAMHCNLEGLLFKAAKQQDFSAEFQVVTEMIYMPAVYQLD